MKEALNRAIRIAGSLDAFKEKVNAPTIHAVKAWKLTRVPAEYCPTIEEKTGVRCEELRPDVKWAVLRGTDCNPAQKGA